MRYNPTRWVCQTKAVYCDGFFYAHSRKIPCPLREKCHGYDRQLEYFYPQKAKNERTIKNPPDLAWQKQHRYNLCRIRQAFSTPEERHEAAMRSKEYHHLWYLSHKPKRPPPSPKPREEVPLPPCGWACQEDDGICPYDDECRYPDWEEEQLERLKAEREKARMDRHHAKERERMRTDPEFRAKRNAYKNAWKRAKRASETPEERAARLAKDAAYRARKKDEETQEQREHRLGQRNKWYAEHSDAVNAKRREAYRAKKEADPDAV